MEYSVQQRGWVGVERAVEGKEGRKEREDKGERYLDRSVSEDLGLDELEMG